MSLDVFKLIKTIATRNGAANFYPLETFIDDNSGEMYLTCDNACMFPECSSEWLFSDVSNKEAEILLTAFMSKTQRFTYEIICHLSRLMAIKGMLVGHQMDDIVASTDWNSYDTPASLLSYLAVKPDGVFWIIRLLDIVPNDMRDGLFTACWYCRDMRVHVKLLTKFEAWIKDITWGDGDREDAWLEWFLRKWIAEEIFSYDELKSLIVWHFQYVYCHR